MPTLETFHRGVAAYQQGRWHEAIDAFWTAAQAKSDARGPAWHNLGHALAAIGQLADALRAHQAALESGLDQAATYRAIGKLHFDRGDYAPAIAAYRQAVARAPQAAVDRVNLGLALAAAAQQSTAPCDTARHDEAQLDAALAELHQAARIEPASATAQAALAQVLSQAGKAGAAVAAWECVCQLAPEHAAYWFNLGNARRTQGELARAVESFRRALSIRPDYPQAWQNLAVTLAEQDETLAALEAGQKWRDLVAGGSSAWSFLSGQHAERGDLAAALATAETAARSGSAEGEMRLAQTELTRGNLPRGWRWYEARKQLAPPRFPLPAAIEAIPVWRGAPLSGWHVLVLPEQGLGEEIMFATCYADLAERAAHTTIAAHPALAAMLQRALPECTVIAATSAVELQGALGADLPDLRVAAGDLPRHFRASWDRFDDARAGGRRTLVVDESAIRAARELARQSGAGLRVGIAWRGGTVLADVRRRSTPLAAWEALASVRGVSLVPLQHDASREELVQLSDVLDQDLTLRRLPAEATFEEHAASVAALDAVVSVANTTLHLAGGLGVPALGLLRCAADWWWFRQGRDCPWYGSVELARQLTAGDWSDVMDSAATWIAHLADATEAVPVPEAAP